MGMTGLAPPNVVLSAWPPRQAGNALTFGAKLDLAKVRCCANMNIVWRLRPSHILYIYIFLILYIIMQRYHIIVVYDIMFSYYVKHLYITCGVYSILFVR